MHIFVTFMYFMTGWVALVLVAVTASRHLGRSRAVVPGHGRGPALGPLALPAGPQPAAQAKCCLEVPCSDECARQHQEMVRNLTENYSPIAVEAIRFVGQVHAQGDIAGN